MDELGALVDLTAEQRDAFGRKPQVVAHRVNKWVILRDDALVALIDRLVSMRGHPRSPRSSVAADRIRRFGRVAPHRGKRSFDYGSDRKIDLAAPRGVSKLVCVGRGK